jgi:capsular polysaccharide biosynthesis protein
VTTPAPPSRGIDPEAEQEVDFAKYVRLLAARWWLLLAGLLVGAVIGYLVSLGGTQVYSASATMYLGQPYSASGNIALLNAQTNPGAVAAVIQSASVQGVVARLCRAKASEFRKGISSQAAANSTSSTKSGQNQAPLVHISVQAKKAKVAACAANQLTKAAIAKLGTFAARKIANFRQQIAFDDADIKTIQAAVSNPGISSTDKLILQTNLRSDQQDKITATQLLLQATQVEAPRLLTPAAAEKITARSRRNTVVISALIGLILGALAALLWDSVVPRLSPRNGE